MSATLGPMAMVSGRIASRLVFAGTKKPTAGREARCRVIQVIAKWKATKLSWHCRNMSHGDLVSPREYQTYDRHCCGNVDDDPSAGFAI